MNIRLPLLLPVIAVALSGCAAAALTAAGVGGGVAASHQMGGMAYRTFTAPLPRVRAATLTALKRMSIPVTRTEKIELGERILARAGDRNIEVEIEALTPNTTRIKAVARKDSAIVVDSATAFEIIAQTEKAFGPN